ncbi:DUF4430 domain-containing protein [Geoglobus sp.]
MKVRFLLFLVLSSILLIPAASALTMSVAGGYKGEAVTVTLDQEAFVIFRMNNGTPVYAYGTQAKFIPHVTGTLYIEARAGNEVVSRTVQVVERPLSGGDGGTSNVFYSGTVYLPDGSFTITADTGKTYTVDWRTALGALKAASQQKGFSIRIKEMSWGPFVSCIAGKCEGSEGATSGWMYQVNGNTPMVGANEYRVSDGDVVVWYFSSSMSDTPDTSSMVLRITVHYATPASAGELGGGAESEGKSEEAGGIGGEILNQTVQVSPGEVKRIDLPDSVVSETSLLRLDVLASAPKVRVWISKPETVELVYGNLISAFNLEVSGAEDVRLEFRVNKSVDRERVVLMKYRNGWIEIPTEFEKEDGDYYYFTANLTNFSTFAIVEKWQGFPLKPGDEPVVKALSWLRSIQNDDGGFANPGEESDVSKTSWAIMAIASAGYDPHDWKKNGRSPVDYLKANLNSSLDKMGTADIARTILAVVAANENPRNFSGVDLVSLLKDRMKDNGQIGDYIYTTIWGVLALNAAGENASRSADWLISQQNDDGGFAWAVGEKSDYDDTAAAVQALIASGVSRDSEVIQKALEYLKTGQNDDGGFRYFGNSSSNAASDAWIIQALVAAGENPMEWRKNNTSVVEHLLSLQTEEGYFRYTAYSTSNPGYMTVCAIMALLGKPHPIRPEFSGAELPVPSPTPVATPTATPTPEITPAENGTPAPVPTATPEVTPTFETTPAKKSRWQIPGFEVSAALLALAVIAAARRR